MIEKTCCVTGHRKIPADKLVYVQLELRKAIMSAVADGYTRFINGGAAGADLLFAAIVAELKEQGCPLYLEAALPYAGRKMSKDRGFQNMLSACNEVKVFSEQYTRGCYFVRNRCMVDESSRVIAVYDGRENGGTVYTMQYAAGKGKTVLVIKIYNRNGGVPTVRNYKYMVSLANPLYRPIHRAAALHHRADAERGQSKTDRTAERHQSGQLYPLSDKDGKIPSDHLRPHVMQVLRRQQEQQDAARIIAGEGWSNPDRLVFTNEIGEHLTHLTVYKDFKAIVRTIGYDNARFHDLRHSYAVAAIESGDDIKTVQTNLGHATAAFTLDVYGHASQKMKQQSADRMEQYILGVLGN